jgi:glucose-1-phosphatase
MAKALGSKHLRMANNPSWPGVKDIIFDFGGVLFDIDYHLPIKAFAELGYVDFGQLYTQSAQNKWFDDLETGKIEKEQFYRYLESLVPAATRSEVEHAWNVILLDLRVPEVQFIGHLRKAGVRTFLLSNTNAIHAAEFEQTIETRMGLQAFRNAFEKIYYSHDIGIKKPYPSTFLQVCQWNDLDPSSTLFIDDSIQHVLGAKEAGLQVHHLQTDEKISTLLAHFLS